MYVSIRFIHCDAGVVTQSLIVHVVHKVISESQEVGGIDLPVYAGKYSIRALFLVECPELWCVCHTVFVTCDLQETVARVRAQAVSLFISCIMDVGDVEWTRVCLMIPRDEEMCAVFYDGATQ